DKQDPPPVHTASREIAVEATDTGLSLVNGLYWYHGAPLDGKRILRYADGRIRAVEHYAAGREEGPWQGWYPDGHLAYRRYFHAGEKDREACGWWPNGQLQYVYHYRMGIYEGAFQEWYQSGHPLKSIIYLHGQAQSGKGWRDNGKPYMNFVIRDGRIYGLMNANLCYSLKDEQGNFRAVRQ
ncbi:MAG TPA: hypothetical protein VG842_01425, partial [Sediminibacterium sp.]|nr:hypothetical protein [Sediminibacterium sp.]